MPDELPIEKWLKGQGLSSKMQVSRAGISILDSKGKEVLFLDGGTLMTRLTTAEKVKQYVSEQLNLSPHA